MTVSVRTIQNRVQKSAELLDKQLPGWFQMIQLNDFNVRDTNKCVVGSIREFLGLSRSMCDYSSELNQGFNLPIKHWHSFASGRNPNSLLCGEVLQRCWEHQIKKRQENPEQFLYHVDHPIINIKT